MAHGQQLPELEITVEEREVLLSFTRTHKTAQQLALRARIVLLCASGSSNMAVAQKLDTTRGTVGRWRKRFVERRLDGLHDEQRPGAPRKISDQKVDKVVRLTLEETPTESTHWSVRLMAKRVGLPPATIYRI